MIYRIDYVLALILAGAAVGALLGRISHIESSRIARAYYLLIAARVVLGSVIFACSIVFANGALWSKMGSGVGDVSNFFFGAIFGVSLVRPKRLALLLEPAVYSALCLSTGFGFLTSGFVKAFYLQGMIEFFVQSGYSMTFLKFIMTAEVLCGAALLIPWAVLPAVAGLSIDMFGAIYTHIHNGDPINDSTGAVAMLIRLGAIAVLWALRPRPSASASYITRRSLIRVGGGALVCLVAAITGSGLARHPIAPAAHAQAASKDDPFEYFVGSWSCAGTFARSGAPVESDLHFEKALDGRWLLFRHDDRPPNTYHALAEWRRDPRGWTATIQDSLGGLRLFHAQGWEGSRLVWEGDAIPAPPGSAERFVFERTDGPTFV